MDAGTGTPNIFVVAFLSLIMGPQLLMVTGGEDPTAGTAGPVSPLPMAGSMASTNGSAALIGRRCDA
jgi:hypothetical protein